MFSGGKDSIVMLRLAEKAFYPAKIPFPVLQVDTGFDFAEVLETRDNWVNRLGVRLVVASVDEAIKNKIVVDDGKTSRKPTPLQVMTAVAAWTERIGIGSSILVTGNHWPLQLANELAIIDQLSEGRLTAVGFGVGWSHEEHHAVG
jgi:alkanesulfonate monooxygenase SsuD/methylene tetrahydromethanopterin reductase-like flavin-dependent oxidoreductase (luciferase family)